MARPSLRSDDVAEFRSRLVAAALHLFATRGYEAVSLRSLGQALGCSAAAPYRYFAGKRDILSAVRAAGFGRLAEAQGDRLDDRLAAGDELRRLAHGYQEFARREPHAFRVMFELEGPGADRTKEERAAERRAWNVHYGAVRRAVEKGVLTGDPTVQTELFWASIHGIASLHLSGKLSTGDTTDSLVESLMDTWLTPSPATDRAQIRPPRQPARTPAKGGEPPAEWKVW